LFLLTRVPDPKHFGTDPDPELDIMALRIRFRILYFFQHAFVLEILSVQKTYMVLYYYMFKSKQVNVLMIFFLNKVIKYRKKVLLLLIVVVVVDSITAHKKKDLDSKEIMSDPDPRDPNFTSLSDLEHCLTHTVPDS
jgi:hypothetical protein